MAKTIRKIITAALFLTAGIEFLITASLYIWSIPDVRQTIVLATTVQPERFTELYFENHTQLPSQADINREYVFKFTAHNLEYRDMNLTGIRYNAQIV